MSDDDLLEDISDEERRAAADLAADLEQPDQVQPGSDAAFLLALAAAKKYVAPVPSVEEAAIERAIEARRIRHRSRTWMRLALAAIVLLVALPAGSRLWIEAQPASFPTADEILGAPPDDDEAPSERLRRIARARTRSYFRAVIGEGTER